MTFRIDLLVGGENAIVLRVRGRVDTECLNTLKEPIEAENAKIVRGHLTDESARN
jgi:hypothetical protein